VASVIAHGSAASALEAAPLDTADWPLVGRDAELAGVRRALGGGRAGVVLAGGPGVGKTRLVREAVGQTEQRDHVACWLTTNRAAASIPLGAFAHLLPAGRAPANPLALLGRVTRSLGARAQGRRLVLGIDDAHLVDDVSAGLVQQLAGTGQVFVVAALRTGEPAPDAITAVWKEGLADRLEVHPLGQQHVEELVSSVLGGPVSVPTSLFLWNMTHGNVLFLREVVMAGLEGGALTSAGRTWCWQGPLEVSSRLADVVESSIGRLDDDETAMLEVLAQGEPLEARVLEAWFPADALHSVERRGLLTSQRDGGRLALRLTNPLYGHVLRARTPVLRGRAIRRELGDALVRTGARRRDDTLRIAAWRLESAGTGPPELMLRAAQEALAAFDHPLAERMARAARDAGGDGAACLALAQSLYLQGRSEEALQVLEQLEPAAVSEPERVWIAALRAQALCWGLGRAGEAEAVLVAAEATASQGSPRELLRAVRAAVLLSSGRLDRALEAATSVIDGPGGDERGCAPAALTAAYALAAAGRSERALAVAARWIDAAGQMGGGVPFAPGGLLPAQCAALRLAGWLDDAAARSEQGYRGALARGDRHAAVAWAATLGRTALDRGHAADARRWLNEALVLSRECGHVGCLAGCLAWLAEAEALLGDVAEAAGAVERAEALRTAATALYEVDVALAGAWLAAARGDVAGARAAAAGAAATAERSGHLAAAVVALHTVARFGGAASVAARLERLAAIVDGPLAPACADHAAAVAARDGAALDRAAAAFEAVGAHLLAAEAAAEAAAAHCAKGRRGRSLSSSAIAHALLDRCGGARTPALLGLKASALTQRERQVALLAAQGLSSRVIAERLDLSVRTVDNHLQVAYGKLGITGRRALAEALD
jgi:DNA-binding CsgD family transcriptional regulator